MNDILTKILLAKEEKLLKFLEEKKKAIRKEIFEDFSIDLDERIQRDAMSQFQGDKAHHKRSSNYNDINQWDYPNQQNIQTPNNYNRRGHFSFGSSSQTHSIEWNPMSMGMNMARQANPYYSNRHGHITPAHAHTEFRYNQWNTSNQKNIANIHNAHSQNALLSQARRDIKHHSDLSNAIDDFGLLGGPAADFSKLHGSSRDIMLCSPSFDKSNRSNINMDHLTAASSTIRNPTVRNQALSTRSKTVINNPLSDLQMLVTCQDIEKTQSQKSEYQQESVDLSKQKENFTVKMEKLLIENSTSQKNLKSLASAVQTQNIKVLSSPEELCEKPVELTSKSCEKKSETEIAVSEKLNSLANSPPAKSENPVNANIKLSNKPYITNSIINQIGNSFTESNKSEEAIPKDEKTNSTAEDENTKQNSLQNNLGKVTNVREESEKNESSSKPPEESNNPESNGAVDQVDNVNENPKDPPSSKRKADEQITENEEKKKSLVIVESQVEGALDAPEGPAEENSDLPTVSSTSAETRAPAGEIVKKTPKKKPNRKSRTFRLSSGRSSSSESQFYSKKFRTPNKDHCKKKIKKSFNEVVERRGPFLHVEGSRECPSYVTVINFPKDDEDEKDKSALKKQALSCTRSKHHNELDYRGKSKNGLFSSTLSSRYDSHSTDYTWVCVFCKKGPHYNALGDLFGPYIISKCENNSLGDFSGDEKDISEAQKRGGRNKKSLRSNNMVEHFQKMSKKLRRSQSNDNSLVGMTVIPNDDEIEQVRYEVWVHEQCAVWSPNVFLIGSRIVGMQEAIWCSVKTMCSKCGVYGANIGCVFRNCPNRSHYHCAKENGWSLEQETFVSTCHIHKPRS